MYLKDYIEQFGDFDLSDELVKTLRNRGQKRVWDIAKGDEYFFINYGKTQYDEWGGFPSELDSLNAGDVFLTEGACDKEIERRNVETLLLKHGGRRHFEAGVLNHCLWLDVEKGRLEIAKEYDFYTQGAIYFDTEEQAQAAIEEIGKERIEKALFEVKWEW